MMTVLELIDAIEDAGVDYDDPIVIVRPVVGKADERYAVTRVFRRPGGRDRRCRMSSPRRHLATHH